MAMASKTSAAASLASGLDEERDLAELCETLYPITNKYKHFALQIGVKKNEITRIEKQYNDPSECLMEILSFRLKLRKPLTWANIVKALRSQSVGEHQLANKIENLLCSDDPCSEAAPGKKVHVDVGDGQSKSGTLEKTCCSSCCSWPLEVSFPQLEPQGKGKQIHKAKKKHNKGSARCKDSDDDLNRKEEEVVEMSDESSSPSSSETEIFNSEEEIEPPSNLPSTRSKSSADYSKKKKRKRKTKAHKSETTKKICTKESNTMEDEERETSLVTEKSTQELLEHKRKGKTRRRRKRLSQQSKLHTEPERSVVEMEHNESSATSSDDETTCSIVHIEVKESTTPLENESQSEKDGNKVRKRKRKRKPKKEDGESENEGKESIEKMSSKKGKPTQEVVKGKVRKRKRKSKSRVSPAAVLDKIHSPSTHHRTQQTMEKGYSEEEELPSDASSDGEQLELKQRESQNLQRKGKVPLQRSTGTGKASIKPSLDQQIEGEYSSPHDSGSEPHKKRKSRKRVRDGSSGNGTKRGQGSGLVVDNIQNELEDEVESCSEGCIEQDSERFPSTEEETESTTSTSEGEESSQSNPYGGRSSKRRKNNRRRGNGKYRGRQRKHTSRGQRKHDNGVQKQMMERERKEEKMMSSSETDDSISPERAGLKRLSEDEAKNLKKVFKSFYGRLCVAISDPASLAVELQARALLSRSRMDDILQSPESRQSKVMTLVRALQRRINGRPNKLFTVIQLFLENDCLKKEGREMWTKTGELFPNRTAAVLGSKLPPPPTPPTPPHSLPPTSHTPPSPSYPTPLPPSHSPPHPPPSSLSSSTPRPLPDHANAVISSTAGESSKDETVATTSETVNQPQPSLSPIAI